MNSAASPSEPLGGRSTATSEVAQKESVPPRSIPSWNSYSLSTLFVIMTGCCLLAAASAVAPPLGTLCTFLAIPAFFRTRDIIRRYAAVGEQVSAALKLTIFLGGVFLALILLIMSLMVFVGLAVVALGVYTSARSANDPWIVRTLVGLLLTGFVILPTVLFVRLLNRRVWLIRELDTFPVPIAELPYAEIRKDVFP